MFKRILIAFLIWKVALICFALIARELLPMGQTATARVSAFGLPYLQWVWGNFDGIHYVEIARAGYQYPNYAFFPFYPLLISIGQKLLAIRLLQAGLLISNLSLLISLFFLYKIAHTDFDKIAWRSIVLLLVFPTAFFYSAVYADSLYLLLSLTSFYAARKSRWFLAGVLGGLASATRLVGTTLILALLLEWYLQNKEKTFNMGKSTKKFFKTHAFWILLVPLGTLGYMLYLQIMFGDFLLFQKAMAVWSQSKFVLPPQVIFRYLKIIVAAQFNLAYFVAIIELVATISYFALSIYVLKRVRLSYGIFMLLTLLIPTFTGTFQSMPRYMLHLFPGFIALALLTTRSKKLFWPTIVVFFCLQLVFAALFTRGYFIA